MNKTSFSNVAGDQKQQNEENKTKTQSNQPIISITETEKNNSFLPAHRNQQNANNTRVQTILRCHGCVGALTNLMVFSYSHRK